MEGTMPSLPASLLLICAALHLSIAGMGGNDPKSCECWKWDECPNNCTGQEFRGLLHTHDKFFESIQRPFVIFFPWFKRSRRLSSDSEKSKCGSYAGIRRFWITLLGKKHVLVHLNRQGSIIDTKLYIITATRRNMIRAQMSDSDFRSYQTGNLEEGKNLVYKDSYAAVEVCRGLRGVISVGGRSFLIRPLQKPPGSRISGRPHVIYPAPQPKIERKLRSKTFWLPMLPDSDSPLINVTASRWILNLQVILDHQLINRFNRVRDRANFFGFFAARLINLATHAFRDTGILLRLSSVLMMEQPGRIRTNPDIKDTLNHLVRYLRGSAPDVATMGNPANATLLLTTQVFKAAVEYLAVPSSMCTGYERTVGVVQVLNHTDEYHVSKLISLALADMFGLPGLPCPKHMSCESGPVLSNGDRKRLANSIIMGAANCLVQIPARKKPIQDPPKLCGNGIIDRGEECDSKTSPCCLSDICLVRAGVQCLDGAPHSVGCCRNCTLLAAGTVCRRAASACDLPELCNGRTGACPVDTTLEDGQPCGRGDRAFCYRGRCPTLNAQCQEVWGPGARAASEECFRQINTQRGHCGPKRRKCNRARNTMCGVLHCQGGGSEPVRGESYWRTMPSDNATSATECKYLNEKAPPSRRFVSDGTRCDERRLCLGAECRPVGALFKSRCPSGPCSRRGVCLSSGKCLCRLGWGGTACDRPIHESPGSAEALLVRLWWKHLDGSSFGKVADGDGSSGTETKKANGGLDTVTLVIILASVIGGGAFCLVVIFMLCYRRRSSRQRSANMAGNGDALWANKGPGYALPKDQLHMDYTDGIERRKRKRKRRGRQRRNSRGKIIGSRYGEADYVEENESMERIIKFGSMPSYREDKMHKGMDALPPAPTFSSLKAGTSAGLGLPSGSGSFGSGSDSGCPGRPPPPPQLARNALSASSAAGSPADAYAAALSGCCSAGVLPQTAGDSSEGRHPEKGILKNKKIGDLQELANLLSDKVRHSVGPEQPLQPGVVELPAPAAPPFQVSLPPKLPPPPPPARTAAAARLSLHLECSHEKTNAISGSSCTSDDDSSSCSSLSSTGTAVQPPVILCNAGQQTEPVPTDDSEPEDGSCVTGGEGLSEPEVDQDFLKEESSDVSEVKSTEGTCWDSAEEELTDGEELLPRAVLRSAELLEDFAQKIPSTNLLLRSLQQQAQHKAPLYRDKGPLDAGAVVAVPQPPEAARRKRQSYTKATESYESLPSGPSSAC